ncbi:MAG: TIGR00730 family Rossman fold protein [Nitrospirota bacterium]|nr:TIGR00730 family Rossman fold protein [Nitrospirota bacterium]MDE3225892.1 TIGR00730 family Rossman fold protein [Nitrospirota bacterium]MDE3243398.1 TIGR00730 family Rossman fold protein [Nitrospirota bacterium]
MKRICVFCGSREGHKPVYAEAARTLGGLLAREGIGLVYGGGGIGLMKILADAVLDAGGSVIGVIPQALTVREIAHPRVADLRVVGSMHERKALMGELSDAFVALPGGYGTLEEFCEVVTWAQLGLHRKPCGLLNVAGFYDPLLAQLDYQVTEGFLRPATRSLVIESGDPERLLMAFSRYRASVTEQSIGLDQT